jgi:hypothetical protein
MSTDGDRRVGALVSGRSTPIAPSRLHAHAALDNSPGVSPPAIA